MVESDTMESDTEEEVVIEVDIPFPSRKMKGLSNSVATNFAILELAARGDSIGLQKAVQSTDVNVVDADGFTALMLASAKNHTDAVRLLLQCGADTTTQTIELGNTALHFASRSGGVEVCELLCNANPESVMYENFNGGELDNSISYIFMPYFVRHSSRLGLY
jgi:ankyrin repeat protein